jgi:UDP-glucose 4-epimerase
VILVTGSAGHLGEALLRVLARRGADAVDIKGSPHTSHVGSICDRSFLNRVVPGVRAIVHAASLHKPHLATHSAQQFVETNVSGTLALLEAAIAHGVDAFILTSTTSAFGSALTPSPGEPAAWVTEDTVPVPKNIYGVTKVAAETVAELFHRRHGLPTIILRTSRFFPEADDDPVRRAIFTTPNAQANELLYRRADIDDIVSAHLAAIDRAADLRFGRYIVSATTPFLPSDLRAVRTDLPSVVGRIFPEYEGLYARAGWRLFETIDRVYVNDRARAELAWTPRYDFAHVLESLRRGEDYRSPLAREVGAKGYHEQPFDDGIYPVTLDGT